MKSSSPLLCNNLRIGVRDLRLGMFIAELDRPWTDTPFLIQGFLLEDAAHLAMLHKLVAEVTIDPIRSTADSLLHLPWDLTHHAPAVDTLASAPGIRSSLLLSHGVAASTSSSTSTLNIAHSAYGTLPARLWKALQSLFIAAPQRKRSEQPRQPSQHYLQYATENSVSKQVPPSTPQFSRFIESLYPHDTGLTSGFLEKFAFWRNLHFMHWFSRSVQAKSSNRSPALRAKKDRPDFLPANMPLVIYRDSSSIEEETVKAREIMQHAEVVLEKIVSDIESDLPIDILAVSPVVTVLVDSVVRNPAALMWSARMRGENRRTYLHGLKVAIYLMVLGRHLGFPKEQLSELGNIGLLLDVGMLKMPAALLEKPGALMPEEITQMIQHVQYGIEALEQGEPLPHYVARGIQEHHERIDGSGYPLGLAGEEISIYGRMAAIADTFAAMTTARSYDVTYSAFDAMKELFKESAAKLHGPLVEQFVQAICIFPVGSLIELASGEAAIVLEHNGMHRLAPKILVLTDADKAMLATPYELDLMTQSSDQMRILRGLADGAYGINFSDYYLG